MVLQVHGQTDFIGVFDNSTDASTVFQSNTFNEDMTLTWTNTSGGCSGSTTTITARFNQPSATGSMDTDSWIWGGLTNSAWSNGSNWYKGTDRNGSFRAVLILMWL